MLLSSTDNPTATSFRKCPGWIKEYMNAIRTKYKEMGLGKEKIQEFMGKAQGTAFI